MIIVLAAVGVQAQNTGAKPFVGSTHTYTVTRGLEASASALVWTVLDDKGDALLTPDDHFGLGTNGSESMSITWPKANNGTIPNYIVQVTETANVGSCPTIRQFTVIVEENAFDVIAALTTAATDCAGISNPVKDELGDGSNGNDVFGTTQRVYEVTMTGGDIKKDWSFQYAITGAAASFDGYTVDVDGATLNAGDYVVAGAGATATISNVATITVKYNTNKQATVSGQDDVADLVLTISNAKDSAKTLEADVNKANNVKTYTINPVPATTGIIAD